MNLEDIENPLFLQNLSKKELKKLCEEIRQFLIENISKTGGHLASNLGVVELTVALHYVFHNQNDKLIFDVGHQAYTHKILTGRAKDFKNLRKTGGLSGFTNYDESPYDCWESGHSSTSISALSGFLLAKRNGNKEIGDVVSIIGDSSIANGMAFEALNFASTIDGERPIIILNDNKMGISKSVGALSNMFNMMRRLKFYRGLKRFLIKINPRFVVNWFHQVKRSIKGLIQTDNIFEDMGYDYYGPYDGNDLNDVIRALERAKISKSPCVIHFLTKKGLGYEKAENDELGSYHGVGPFDISTGKSLKIYEENEFSYSEIVAKSLIETRRKLPFILINPATMVGNRLIKFEKEFPQSIFDVGIAEEHAATMAAAIALNKQKVALLIYSTFAQRCYDQILNDIARRNLNVVMGFDRAGLIAEEGSTHQGIYDIAMLNSMPNITICMGKNLAETKALISYAFKIEGPVVVRYPKANEIYTSDLEVLDMRWQYEEKGSALTIISYGHDVMRIKRLINENNIDASLVNARFIRPIDKQLLIKIFDDGNPILVVEQVVKNGSLGQLISSYANEVGKKINLTHLAIDTDEYIIQASYNDLLNKYHLDNESILKEMKKICA